MGFEEKVLMDTMNSSYNSLDTITIGDINFDTTDTIFSTIYSNISPTYTFESTDLTDTRAGALKVSGDAVFDGNLSIKGKDIGQALERIEERLAILHPNEELEERWEQLRNLRKQYLELEAEIVEKEKIYNILQK